MEIINPVFTQEFIKMVRDRPFLYNAKHPEYRNQRMKTEAWKEIANKLRISPIRCRSKWKALRDQFVRELKRLEACRDKPGIAPRWRYYDHLRFLRDSLCPIKIKVPYRRSKISVNGNENEETQLTDFYTGFSEEITNDNDQQTVDTSTLTETIPFSKHFAFEKREETSLTIDKCDDDPFHAESEEIIENHSFEEANEIQSISKNVENENEIDAFFRSIATKIKNVNFPPVELVDLQIQILQVISNKLHGPIENTETSTDRNFSAF